MPTPQAEKEYGVFLPIANGGWIISKNTPPLDGSYKQNRDAAVLADEIGLDFIMSMSKWRGFGGETDHWGTSLESLTMMAGIAEATKNARLIGTVHTLVHNPAVVAKMIATIDQISGGRAGLNIVSGSYIKELGMMGAWRDDIDHDGRYDYAEEWATILTRLWKENSVDFDGKYFHFEDCVSSPKPLQSPRPFMICAGMSEKGLSFTVRYTDACFIGGKDKEDTLRVSRLARDVAARHGTTTKTFCMCTVVHDETDAKAEKKAEYYREGLDIGAVKGMMRSYGMEPDGQPNSMIQKAQNAFMSHTAVGTPETCTEQIRSLIKECELDGVMFIFPDYVEGLTMLGKEILPQLRAELV